MGSDESEAGMAKHKHAHNKPMSNIYHAQTYLLKFTLKWIPDQFIYW